MPPVPYFEIRAVKKRTVIIWLSIAAICLAVPIGGCLCGSQEGKNSTLTRQATTVPTMSATPFFTQTPEVSPAAVVTIAPTQASPESTVVKTASGYVIKGSRDLDSPAQIQLKAGKATFHIVLSEYSVGDSYTLKLSSAGGPFSYTSTHEFSGDSSAGDIKLEKKIPLDGMYSVSLDYGSGWELEITQ